MPHTATQRIKALTKMREFPAKWWTAKSLALACGYSEKTAGMIASALRTLAEREQVHIAKSTIVRGQVLNFWTLS